MAAGHAELVGEMVALERLSMPDRLKHAKKRRAQQLKAFAQYEKQLTKETTKKTKKGQGNGAPLVTSRSTVRLRFDPSILLLEATMRNDVEEVNNLLNTGVDPNVSNEDGLRALHQCSIDNLEEIMKLLIQFGANVNVCDTELWTPLHAAATCGHLPACQYLIEHGAELLAVNSDGNMPYDLCEDPDTLDFIESEMAKRGVTQEMIDDIRLSAENKMLSDLKQLNDAGSSLEYNGSNGETPLHVAACNGYVYVAEFLLTHHVAVNVVDDDGWMPLHCAACWGQLQLVEILLMHGADFEARTKSGETTLDLCEDVEMKHRVLEIVEEIETKQPSKSKDNSMKRRNSAARKGSAVTAHAMRRTNDKSSMAHIEAQEEALRLRESINSLDEDEDDENFTVLNAITVPHATEADDIDLHIPEDTPAENVSATKHSEPVPIKSIISSKNNNNRNSRSEPAPLSSDIWMSSGTNEKASNESSTGKDTKKDKKKDKKDIKTDKSAKSVGKSGSESSGDMTNKQSSASARNSNGVTSSETTVNAKPDAHPAHNARTSVPANSNRTQLQAGAEIKEGNGRVADGSGKVQASANSNASKDDGKNKQQSKDGTGSRASGAVAPPRGTGAATRNSEVASTGTGGSSVATNPGKSNHVSDGYSSPPTGTLADLKKQRAKRIQDTLAAKENGRSSVLPAPNSANGSVVDAGDRNANTVVPHRAAGTSPIGADKTQQRRGSSQEAMDGNDRKCCVIL